MMKKIVKITILVITVLIVFYLGFLAYLSVSLKKTEAYKIALIEIEKNELVQSKSGGIVEYGMFPNGKVQGNEAILSIKVIGKNKEGKVVVFLTRLSDNRWKMYQMLNFFE